MRSLTFSAAIDEIVGRNSHALRDDRWRGEHAVVAAGARWAQSFVPGIWWGILILIIVAFLVLLLTALKRNIKYSLSAGAVLALPAFVIGAAADGNATGAKTAMVLFIIGFVSMLFLPA
jgi:hypothetical protein